MAFNYKKENGFIDIRDKISLSGAEFKELNFINASGKYEFRKFYRSGLRSHILEILTSDDIKKETQGVLIDGLRMFPRARPVMMFRILRHKFKSTDEVFQEIKKYTILLDALGPEYIALSNEIIVDYLGAEKNHILLCGLQEYVDGEILDPWRFFGPNYLHSIYKSMTTDDLPVHILINKAKRSIKGFVKRIRKMISDTGYLPDLAGIGNLILTRDAQLKLVDINNIVEIKLDDHILIDDKGYPSCDVSVEVLSILERDLLNKEIHMNDPLYNLFLAPSRRKEIKKLEKRFYKKLEHRR